MDPRVKKAVAAKIDEAISNADEVYRIQSKLGIAGGADFAFGIAIGRIYNSFHYQTRRILGRNATAAEFSEFLSLLSSRTPEIRRAFSK
ncbi:4-hydroxy-3-methylbut-2-en-1-yl diphosphate synthase [Candidatus Nitrososphaera evergladensis SR1]|uniref:4-hydroxy-3-methylbut-2-en-1-yl diphosphate synthase n=1 Tax=Candidatus Nitrososphaera evergladensis SR1 TaxID=1459636 RepID=A0A075MVP1_9ARCH|nr:hypothetical protein [Candidatus Nitrososphaera evergladensis]AIF83369.1 4-hydroxy-3-methylbut-2-en-1-yl diphosphate synthase [Candidatus Nitrososphaera evergladensis SR1]